MSAGVVDAMQFDQHCGIPPLATPHSRREQRDRTGRMPRRAAIDRAARSSRVTRAESMADSRLGYIESSFQDQS